MARPPQPPPPLVLAAQELENEIRHFEEALAESANTRLNTEKHMGRAARALETAAGHHDRLGERLKALLAAIQTAQGRLDSASAGMEARAADIKARLAALQAFQVRGVEIAAEVRQVNELAQETSDPARILERLAPLEKRVAEAHQQARTEEFVDVAKDIDELKKSLALLRKKLKSV